MGMLIAIVGIDQVFAPRGGGVLETSPIAGFVIAGLLLIFAEWRLCTRNLDGAHCVRYASPKR